MRVGDCPRPRPRACVRTCERRARDSASERGHHKLPALGVDHAQRGRVLGQQLGNVDGPGAAVPDPLRGRGTVDRVTDGRNVKLSLVFSAYGIQALKI